MELSKLIRSGKFCSSVSKLVLVGHSTGSVTTNSVLHTNPGLVDGAVLTGLAYNSSGVVSNQAKQLRLANLQNPAKWGKLDGGYMVWVDIFSTIETYGFLPLLLDY